MGVTIVGFCPGVSPRPRLYVLTFLLCDGRFNGRVDEFSGRCRLSIAATHSAGVVVANLAPGSA